MQLNGYPEGALERLQRMEFELLIEVRRVCAELGLTWFIDSGTCLGAVRHGGFIPWDDDIDVALPLEDYRTFCAQAPALLAPEYGLYTHAGEENYPPLWAKLYKRGTRFMSEQMAEAGFEQGVFVDVFAFAQLDSHADMARKQTRSLEKWQRMSYLYHFANPHLPANVPCKPVVELGCRVAHGLVRVAFSPQSIEQRFDRIAASGDGSGRWCDLFYSAYGSFEEQTLFPTVEVEFWGEKFPAPRDTDTYLTTMYGDYRTLPPEEERGAHPPVVLDFGDGVNVMEAAAGE